VWTVTTWYLPHHTFTDWCMWSVLTQLQSYTSCCASHYKGWM